MIFILKALPAVIAFSFLMNTVCAFLLLPFQVITHYLGLVIAPLAFIYISSYVFKFCEYHRWFVHYIAITELINITDWYWKIPISNEAICIVHFIISGIFLFGILIYYIKKKYEKNRKIFDSYISNILSRYRSIKLNEILHKNNKETIDYRDIINN